MKIWLLLMLVFTGCYRVSPDGEQEAVLTIKPYVFGHGGVDPTPITAGATWVAISTHADYVSKQPLQASVHFEDLMSLDGVPLDFDVVIRLQVTDSVTLIRDFGPKWYENNILAEFQNRVRQAVRSTE